MTAREAFEHLQLPVSATPLEARAAYRSRVRALHPDRHQDKTPEEQRSLQADLRAVNAAWEFLEKFYELPLVQRRHMLGIRLEEPETDPPVNRLRRRHRRRVSPWLMLPVATLPLLGAIFFLHRTQSVASARAGASATAPMATSGRTWSGDASDWTGVPVLVAACSDAPQCNPEGCDPGAILHALRTEYGFGDARVLYADPEDDQYGFRFYEVTQAVRADVYSVRPRVVVAGDLPAAAARLALHRGACPLQFRGPFRLATYAGPLASETRVTGRVREETVQLDVLRVSPDGLEVRAEFVGAEPEDRLTFRYPFHGSAVPLAAPRQSLDAGSLYQMEYQKADYLRQGAVVATNLELRRIRRLTGELESKIYENVPLRETPRSAIREVERVDLPGIRKCQALRMDEAGFTACALRLLQTLQESGRISALMAHELRFRFRNPGLD